MATIYKTIIPPTPQIIAMRVSMGFGASELLKQHNIEVIEVKPGSKVEKVIREAMHTHKG